MTISRWWFQTWRFIFTLIWGSSNGLVQPPSRFVETKRKRQAYKLCCRGVSHWFQDRIGKWSLMDNIILFLFVWDPSDVLVSAGYVFYLNLWSLICQYRNTVGDVLVRKWFPVLLIWCQFFRSDTDDMQTLISVEKGGLVLCWFDVWRCFSSSNASCMFPC